MICRAYSLMRYIVRFGFYLIVAIFLSLSLPRSASSETKFDHNVKPNHRMTFDQIKLVIERVVYPGAKLNDVVAYFDFLNLEYTHSLKNRPYQLEVPADTSDLSKDKLVAIFRGFRGKPIYMEKDIQIIVEFDSDGKAEKIQINPMYNLF